MTDEQQEITDGQWRDGDWKILLRLMLYAAIIVAVPILFAELLLYPDRERLKRSQEKLYEITGSYEFAYDPWWAN